MVLLAATQITVLNAELSRNELDFLSKIELRSKQLKNTGETPSVSIPNETHHFIAKYETILYFKGRLEPQNAMWVTLLAAYRGLGRECIAANTVGFIFDRERIGAKKIGVKLGQLSFLCSLIISLFACCRSTFVFRTVPAHFYADGRSWGTVCHDRVSKAASLKGTPNGRWLTVHLRTCKEWLGPVNSPAHVSS